MWLASPAHARWLENEFDALVGFASEAGTPHGFGYLDDAGEVVAAKGHDLFITCRMTHVFALAHLLGRPGAAKIGRASCRERGWSAEAAEAVKQTARGKQVVDERA